MEEAIEKRAARIRLLLMDCDGVLTDGRLWLLENGDEQKSFNVKDGLGLHLCHRAGLQTGIISGRASSAVERRARELRIEFIRQGEPDSWNHPRAWHARLVAAAWTLGNRAASLLAVCILAS